MMTTALLGVGGALFGIQELYAVAASTGVILISAAAWVRRCQWSLRSSRVVTPARLPVGAPARVEVTLRNDSGRRSPVLAVRDTFDRGRHRAAFAVASLDPGETVSISYAVPTTERGVFDIGPLDLELADPFGLARASHKGVGPSKLTVHPRIVVLSPPHESSESDQRPPDVTSLIAPQGSDFYAVREYRSGDDLRRVHWASTARLGELMIRQDETPAQGRLTMAVDLRTDTWAAGGLETALATAASIAEAALSDGLDVRLVTTTGVDTDLVATTGRRLAVLDALAGARTSPDTGAAEVSSGTALGEAVMVVTSRGSTLLSLLARYSPGLRQLATAVLVSSSDPAMANAGSQPATGEPGIAGMSVINVSGGIDSLPQAWARAQASMRPVS